MNFLSKSKNYILNEEPAKKRISFGLPSRRTYNHHHEIPANSNLNSNELISDKNATPINKNLVNIISFLSKFVCVCVFANILFRN